MEHLRLDFFLSGDDYYHIHRSYINAGGPDEIHNHNFSELLFVEKGSGIHYLNDRRIRLEQNDLFIIRPYDSHYFSSSGSLQFVNIAFPIESLYFFCGRYGYQLMEVKDSLLRWSLNGQQSDTVGELVSTLVNRDNNRIILEAFLMNLFVVLGEADRALLHGESELNSNKPQAVLSFLDLLADKNNLGNNLDDLAEIAGYSREHLSRQIKYYTNKTPSQLMREARVKYATRELSMNKMSILDIALFCGYSSLSQFYKIFKEATGYTPSGYRKNNIRIIGGGSHRDLSSSYGDMVFPD